MGGGGGGIDHNLLESYKRHTLRTERRLHGGCQWANQAIEMGLLWAYPTRRTSRATPVCKGVVFGDTGGIPYRVGVIHGKSRPGQVQPGGKVKKATCIWNLRMIFFHESAPEQDKRDARKISSPE